MKYILFLFQVAHMFVTYYNGDRNLQSPCALLNNKIISFCLDFKIQTDASMPAIFSNLKKTDAVTPGKTTALKRVLHNLR